ncbi:MAG: PglZ domain-containing protein, partial [Anaerolineae bacterium]|nr:PglZ domain-containing protein [Anaerolineae bacterium]
ATFKRRALALDAQYALGAWAVHLPPETVGSSFLNVEQALWQQVQARLDGITDKAGALDFVGEERDVFRQRAASFWAREGDVPGWQALEGMQETLHQAQAALAEIAQQPTPAAMVARYATAWWKVDAAYRRFSAQLDRTGAQVDAALKWTARIYREYLGVLNERFTALAAAEGQWPPAQCALAGPLLWSGAPSGGKGLRALVMVDALRYELAHALAARLGLNAEQVQARLSPIPSITELGMAALLPGWEHFRLMHESEWIIQAPGSSDNLARKDKRLAYLVSQLEPNHANSCPTRKKRASQALFSSGLSGLGQKAAIFDLDQWLATPLNSLEQNVSWIVVTSQAIDAAGEGIGAVALHTFDALLERLEHGIRRLRAAGCTEITIVSDHGFLLRETIREADKVKAREPGLLKKNARYAVGPSAAYPDAGADWAALPHFPVHGSDLTAWFPRGVGCFLTPGPYNYMHGGIALQEVVIPVIQIRQTALERPVGVSLELPTGGLTTLAELRNAIFKVRLIPTGGDLLSTARQVEIDIVKQGQRVSRVWEVRVERDIVEKSLMLETVYGLQFGDTVEIRARDAVTGEVLSAKDAIIKVDLDL